MASTLQRLERYSSGNGTAHGNMAEIFVMVSVVMFAREGGSDSVLAFVHAG